MAQIATQSATRSSDAPALTPDRASYSKDFWVETHTTGLKMSGFDWVSKAAAGKHSSPVPRNEQVLDEAKSGRQGSEWVKQGVGLKVANVGFMVRTDFNNEREPIVRIYPYRIDPKQGTEFYHREIEQTVNSMCEGILRKGIEVNGETLAPRRIVGVHTVLNFHGTMPAEKDNAAAAAPLGGVSFTFKR